MPIQVTCPSCARPLRVPDHLLGQKVKCPACEKVFEASVNEGGAAAPPLAEDRVTERARDRDREYERDRERYDDRDRDREYERDRERYDDRDRDRDLDDRDFERRRRRLQPHRGDTILWLGVSGLILGLMGCIPLGIAAWIMGAQDLSAIRAGRMDPSGEGNTKTGYIMGIIGTIAWVGWLFCSCLIGFLIALGG